MADYNILGQKIKRILKKDFINYIKKEFRFDELEIQKLESCLNAPLKKSIRVNTNKISISEFKKRAKSNGWTLTDTNLGKNTFYIDRKDSKKTALGNTPEHISGYFYVQEVAASSSPFYMSLDKIDENSYLILDMSASPGGKTTGLSEYYPNSLIVANELDKSRLKGFFYNLDRMSSLGVVATNYDGRFFKNIPEVFDKILLDAPCSGEGTAFKADEALKYWNLKNIKVIAKLQFGLMESAIKSLKKGGEIVYSTCTLNKIENEGVIDKLIKKYGDFIEIVPLSDQLDTQSPYKRSWPHTNFTGGFFVAKLKKIKSLTESSNFNSGLDNDLQKNKKWNKQNMKFVRQNIEKLSKYERKIVDDFFLNNFSFDLSKFHIYNYNGEIHLSNKNLNFIWEKIFIYKIGVNIGIIKSGFFIPNFYSGTFSRFGKNTIEVNKENLNKLLRGEEIGLDDSNLNSELIKNEYFQILFDELEMGIVRFKEGKIKSLIPSNLVIN